MPIVTEYNGRGLQAAVREVSKAQGAFGKLGAAGKIAGVALAAGAGAAAIGIGRVAIDAVKAYSDLQETLSKSGQIFGTAAAEVEAFGNTANTALGQTKQQAIDAASTFGIFGKSAGLAGSDLSAFSTSLVSLSADLASFNNTSPEQAITALGAALRGESEPIRAYGVLLDDATLKAQAMRMGIYDGTGSLTQQQRVMAAYQEILRQTTTQQGDFARTSGGLANQMRILAATAEDTKLAFGEGIAAGLGDALGVTGDLTEGMTVLRPIVRNLGLSVGSTAGEFIYLAESAASVLDAIRELTGELDDTANATGEVTNGFDAFVQGVNGANNPIGNLGKIIRFLRGETEAAGAAALQAAADYEALAERARLAALKLAPDQFARSEDSRRLNALGIGLESVAKSADKANKRVGRVGSSASAASKEADTTRWDAASRRLERLKDRFAQLDDELKRAQGALDDYAKGVAGWISSVSIGDAFAAQLDDVAKRADLDQRLADAIAAGDDEGAAKLAAQKAGMGAAVSWVDAFTQQIADRRSAAASIQALMATLNPADSLGNELLINQLTALPPDQARQVADDLVKRGIGPAIAAELSSLDLFAGDTGRQWAQTFYQPGVDAAQQAVNGITTQLQAAVTALYREGRKLGKSFMDGFADATRGLPVGVKIPGPRSVSGLLGAGAAGPVVVNIHAPHGDPVAIARALQGTLRTAGLRTGAR